MLFQEKVIGTQSSCSLVKDLEEMKMPSADPLLGGQESFSIRY